MFHLVTVTHTLKNDLNKDEVQKCDVTNMYDINTKHQLERNPVNGVHLSEAMLRRIEMMMVCKTDVSDQKCLEEFKKLERRLTQANAYNEDYVDHYIERIQSRMYRNVSEEQSTCRAQYSKVINCFTKKSHGDTECLPEILAFQECVRFHTLNSLNRKEPNDDILQNWHDHIL